METVHPIIVIANAFVAALLLHLPTLVILLVAMIAYRLRRKVAFNTLLIGGSAINAVGLALIIGVMYGPGRKDPLDGLALAYFLGFLSLLYPVVLLLGGVCIFVDRPNNSENSEPRKSPDKRFLLIPAVIFIATFLAVYPIFAKGSRKNMIVLNHTERIS